MTTLLDLERRAKAVATTRALVTQIVTELNAGIDALKRDQMPKLKTAIAAAAEQHDRLKVLIEANPELFAKPKSVVYHGIRLGYRKRTGALQFDDQEKVVALIRKHFADQFDLLVRTEEKPIKKALEGLSAAELKKLGITVEDSGDVVFIKPVDSATDKLVDQLLKSATEERATT